MTKTTKQIYLIRGSEDESYKAFKDRIHWEADLFTNDESISGVSYSLTEQAPPSISIIPFQDKKIAAISIYKDDNRLIRSFQKLNGFEGAYQVTEALPVQYEKVWEDGDKTPGVCLLTLFKQKKNIDYSAFIDRWHNSHTPLSLKYHPLWHYNRNVVDKKLAKNSNDWDGIVEEHMKTRSELMNPFKFFGPLHLILQRMIHVYRDTKSFLDYKTIEPYLVAEYRLKG